MSTIKSSAENLTLNADGSGNDIIIQSNGSTKAIITAESKVGIGTTTPARTLHVSDTTSGATTGIRLTGANNGSQVIEFADTDDTNVGYIQYDHGTNRISIRAGDANKLNIDGDGLKFGTDTAAANALDDYEEGTFTPTITGADGGSATHSSQIGRYTKIGAVVNVNMSVGGAKNNISGQMQVSGLPFAANHYHRGFSYEHYLPGGTALVDTQAIIYNNETRIRLWGNTSANNDGTARGLTVSDVNSTASLHFQLTYTTNS